MKHLVSISDLSEKDIKKIFEMAKRFEEVLERRVKKVPALIGKTLALLFVEPSTRTRTSFELAARRLSCDTVSLSLSTSSLKKGETLEDTARTLKSMKIDCAVIRHPLEGAALRLASLNLFPVVNGGDGKREHPTQALLDAYTVLKKLKSLKGKKVSIIGDILHSRVARSGMELWHRLGARVTLVAPPTLLPGYLPEYAEISYSLDEVSGDSDILYFLRIQKERLSSECLAGLSDYRDLYALTVNRLKNLKKDVLIMHPGPVNRGIELDPEVIYDERSLIEKQVFEGVAVRMAILTLLLSKEGGATLEISS